MTTDTTALQERLAYAVHDMRTVDKHPGDDNHPFNIAAAVLPVIAAEVRAAKADAWDEGYMEATNGNDDPLTNTYRYETGDRA